MQPLSSLPPKRPGPRATSPPAWSQYLNHGEGTLGSGDVWTHCNLLQTWWDEQKRWISTKLYGTFYWFCTSPVLYLVVEAGGTTAGPNWWNGAAMKKKKHTQTRLQGLKEGCEWLSDDRGVFSLTDIRPRMLAAALVSELHVTFLHGGKQLI